MKTSVIEVHDMLSVWSVDEVEERIGEVPGVESVTVNYAAGNATVRYDETRLEVADIKAAVRQSGYKSAGESQPKHVSEPKPEHKDTGAPALKAGPASASTSETAGPKASTTAAGASAGDGQQDKAAPGAHLQPPHPPCRNLPRPRRPPHPHPRRRNPPRHPLPQAPHHHRAKPDTASLPGRCWHNRAPQRPDFRRRMR